MTTRPDPATPLPDVVQEDLEEEIARRLVLFFLVGLAIGAVIGALVFGPLIAWVLT